MIIFYIFREWVEVASMEVGRILPGVATLGGKIFVFGGERGSQILANGEAYGIKLTNYIYFPITLTITLEFKYDFQQS